MLQLITNVIALGDASGVSDLATALGGILTADNLFSILTTFVPVIGGIVLFAFAYKRVKKMVSGASNGKAKI